MADYSYEETDFVGLGSPPTANIDIQGLEQQVLASDITSAGLSYINKNNGSVIFTFDQSLSTGSPSDVLILNDIVATHDGTHILTPTGDTILSYSFADQGGTPLKTTNLTFTRSATIVFEGTDFYEKTPAKVLVTGYVDGSAVGGIRLYDLDNDLIIAEGTINSTSEAIVELDIIGEWPEDQATLEFQIKRTEGEETESVSITSLQIIF